MKHVLFALSAIALVSVSISPAAAGALHNRPATYHPYGYYKHGYMYSYGYVPVKRNNTIPNGIYQGNAGGSDCYPISSE